MEHPSTPSLILPGLPEPAPLPPSPSVFMESAYGILSGKIPLHLALPEDSPWKGPRALVFDSRLLPCVLGIAVLNRKLVRWSASWNVEAPCRSAPLWLFPDRPQSFHDIEAFLQSFSEDCNGLLQGDLETQARIGLCDPEASLQLLDAFYNCEVTGANH